MSPEELFSELGFFPAGLSQDEVAKRLDQYGPNEIVEARKSPLILRLAAYFYHTFALLLWVAGLVAFVSGMELARFC